MRSGGMRALDYTAEQYLGTQLQTAETIEGDELQRIDRSVDAVVVGAGPGGLVTGRVLASVGLSVLVLEAGKFWRFREFRRGQTWANEHLYQEKGTRIAKGNTAIPVASGRGVGGGTLVNSGISFRAPVRVLDEWHDRFGVAIWAPERRDAIFEEPLEAASLEGYRPSAATVAALPADSQWFGAEGRAAVMRRALRETLEEIEEAGQEVYGDVNHTGQIGHPLGLEFLGYEAHPRGGSGSTVWNYSWRGPWGGSWEMHADLDGDLFGLLPGGNSGRYFSDHYEDQIERWAAGEYRRLSREVEGDLRTRFVEGDG